MKKLAILIIIMFSIGLNSCDREPENSLNKEKILLTLISIKNGRLYFPNKETFKEYYYDMTNKDEYEIATILNSKFYENNFYSLRPIINEKTEFQAQRHLDKYQKNSSPNKENNILLREEDIFEHFDDLEEILGEDVFQSFLNENAEIQVEDKIYKYTDKGILIAKENFVNEIYTFMLANGVKSLSDFENIDTSGQYPIFNIDGGIKLVTDNIESFVAEKTPAPIVSDGEYGYSGNGNTGNSNNGNNNTLSTTSDEELVDIVNELEICNPDSPFFGNLFGVTKVCHKRFGEAQRVKLKYYSVDFLLA